MASAKRVPAPEASEASKEMSARIRAFNRHKSRRPAARRRLVEELRRRGWTPDEVVAALHTLRSAVEGDLRVLRGRAARRQLGARPAACVPFYAEEAESVIQKVRRLQGEVEDRKSPLYRDLLKLEWAMLIKFVETICQLGQKNQEVRSDEDEDKEDDWTKCSYEELREKARDLGVDVEAVERAQCLAPGDARQAG